jgi:ribosome maturation factor RimP
MRSLAEPTVHEAGCTLVAVEIAGDGHGTIVRLFIDKPNGVTITDCAQISRALSPELDVADPIPGEYRLEVSSPGIERPVETLADFQRFVGYRAKVRMTPSAERRRYAGDLVSVTADTVSILVDGVEHELPFPQIERARLVLDLEQFTDLQSGTVAESVESTVPIQGDMP